MSADPPQALVGEIRDQLWETFPNELPDGTPYSGSYWNEADYEDRDFIGSFWGKEVYGKLLAGCSSIKAV